jgi:hypothetical protein
MLVAHGDYSSIAHCQSKIPAIFQRIFHIFRGISKFMYIYSTIYRELHKTPCGTQVEKHGTKVIEHTCE